MITQFKIFENSIEHKIKIGQYVYLSDLGLKELSHLYDEYISFYVSDVYRNYDGRILCTVRKAMSNRMTYGLPIEYFITHEEYQRNIDSNKYNI